MERPIFYFLLNICYRHLSSANICKICSCLSVKFIGPLIGPLTGPFIGPLIGSGWTCRVNFTCINSGCSWSFGLSQCFSFQAFKIGPIFTPFIRYSVTETLCSVVPYFYCRDGATSIFAIARFIRNYEIRCGLVAKKSSKIHAYNKRQLIINGLQRGLWRRPACQSIFLQTPSHQLLRIPLRHTQPNVRNAEWDSSRGFQKSPSEQVDKERAEQITIVHEKTF